LQRLPGWAGSWLPPSPHRPRRRNALPAAQGLSAQEDGSVRFLVRQGARHLATRGSVALRSCSRCRARQPATRPASRTPSTPTSDRCAHTARASGGEKARRPNFAARTPADLPRRTHAWEGAGGPSRCAPGRAARDHCCRGLDAGASFGICRPLGWQAVWGEGKISHWMHEAPGATGTKGRTDSEKDRATLWERGVDDRFR
jgi:hypothetical protein